MKLRSIICVSAIAAVASASALTSTNTFARLPIIGNTFENAIIAIPLAGCGETNATIYVTNLVMTANLVENDKLIYKNRGKFYAWKVNGSGKWEGYIISDSSGTSVTPSAEQTNLPCGDGCWLVRTGVASRGDSTIYLFGQVNKTSPASVSVSAAANASDYAYTLISYPNLETGLDLNTWNTSIGAADGDTITIPSTVKGGSTTYKYNGSAWTAPVQSTTSKTQTNRRTGVTTTVTVTNTTWQALSTTTTISPGTGFMYGRKGTTSGTILWPAAN